MPEILSPGEVERLLGAVRALKHRAMVMVAYGAGMRASELCALTADDIDSERMLIRVRAGKGDKDRSVMLSERLLATLRAYWRQRPPRGSYLFLRKRAFHPGVEHEMEEDVREQRAHHAPLRGSCVPGRQRAILMLHGSGKPPLHVEEDPPTARVSPHRLHDEVMIEGIEEGPDVEVHNPGR